jgi:hypothetical protein
MFARIKRLPNTASLFDASTVPKSLEVGFVRLKPMDAF